MSSVQSVDRAFELLGAIAVRPLLLTEAAAEVDLPVSTVSRLLGTLVDIGAVARDDDGRFGVGERIAELAGGVDPTTTLTTAAQPHLIWLAETIGESAGLSVPSGGEVLYLSHIDVESDVQIREWTGTAAPMHTVSAGLALLAYLPADEVEHVLAEPLPYSTEVTVVDPGLIRERLEATRALGYVWTGEEYVEGIASVASPVFERGQLVGAVHVHGPAYRFPADADASAIGEQVRDGAAAFSDALSNAYG